MNWELSHFRRFLWPSPLCRLCKQCCLCPQRHLWQYSPCPHKVWCSWLWLPTRSQWQRQQHHVFPGTQSSNNMYISYIMQYWLGSHRYNHDRFWKLHILKNTFDKTSTEMSQSTITFGTDQHLQHIWSHFNKWQCHHKQLNHNEMAFIFLLASKEENAFYSGKKYGMPRGAIVRAAMLVPSHYYQVATQKKIGYT